MSKRPRYGRNLPSSSTPAVALAPQLNEPPRRPDASETPTLISTDNDPANILLMDDQPAKLISYEVILRELGENLITAASVREGVEYLLTKDIAVIVMNAVTPEVDWHDLAELVRDNPRFKKTPIIFISGDHLNGLDQLRGYSMGAVDYVPVPIVPEVLRAKVKVFIDHYHTTKKLEKLTLAFESLRPNQNLQKKTFERNKRPLHGSALQPLPNVPSPFAFEFSKSGTITTVPGPGNWPAFPYPTSQQDHEHRLEACRVLATDLISALKRREYNARAEYLAGLKRYLSRLPRQPGDGNFMMADAEARILRSLFAAEAAELAYPLGSRLKVLLEQHIGLRVFYKEIECLYRDVRSGRIEEPLPLDAFQGVLAVVQSYTPAIFDATVSDGITSAYTAPVPPVVPSAGFPAPEGGNHPVPPVDPFGEVDPRKASDYTIAGIINSLWKAFLEGDKIAKASKAWKDAAEVLLPHVGKILDWLHIFHGDGTPPTPPT